MSFASQNQTFIASQRNIVSQNFPKKKGGKGKYSQNCERLVTQETTNLDDYFNNNII